MEKYITKEEFEDYKDLVKDNHLALKIVDDLQKKQIEFLNKKIEELNSIVSQFLIK